MKKRVLSLLLVLVIWYTMLPQISLEVNAHSVVMTANEFIGYLQYVVDRGDSRYGSGDQYSIGKYEGNRIYFDCWGLGESIICTKGEIVYNRNTSLNPWNLWDTSCGCGSYSGDYLKTQCQLSSDFTNIVPGEWLFRDDSSGHCYHVGYYIGNGKVIESTSDGSYNTQVTTIDSSGHSNIRGSSWTWTSHGKVPWLEYNNQMKCVREIYCSYGKITITKDMANIMDRPCSVKIDTTAQLVESGALNAEYVVTGLYLNTADNYWYQVVTKAGGTGYIYTGNCEFKEFLSDAMLSGLDIPSQIDAGSRYYIKGTLSTTYTNLSSVSFLVYDQSGILRTGRTVDVSGKSYTLDNGTLDALVEYNALPAGTYRNVIQAHLENYSATECWTETITLHTSDFVVGNGIVSGTESSSNALKSESASFISRSDGIWLWPMPVYTMSDWAGCNGNSSCYFHPGDNHGGCAAWSHATADGYGHSGFDAAASTSTPVYAMADGTAYVRYQDARGYYVVVEHPLGKDESGNSWSYYTYYQHLSEFTVADGTPVSVGTTIGKTGNSGTSTGPHLHVGMVLGKSGCYDSIYDLECKGWVITSGFQEGRILNNPALNSPAGNPTYTDGCEANVKMHAGSVMYTFNKAEVNIGFGDSVPVCAYDIATGGVNSVQVIGWAYDPDTPNESLQINVYMDGVCIGTGVANTLREDVNAVYGCGSNHGFDITIPVTVAETGNHSIEVYALNTNTSGGNAYLGSKEVTITAHAHSYAIAIIKEATCTQEGLKTYTCQSCADIYTEETPAMGHNYISEVIGATCTTVGHTAFTCDRCGDRYVKISGGWSEWSTEYPTGVPENLIEEKTQYSTLEKEYTTSTSNTLEGWIHCGTTYGDWGAVQTTTTKPTESDTLRITQTTQTGWGYYHWCNYYYNGGNNWNVDSVEYGSPCYWHGYTSSFELPVISFQDQGGQQAYGGTGSGAVHCDYNFYIWFRNTGADVYTYSYQTRSFINQFYKWSDKWSDWSDEEATSNEDCQVKTQTVYRHYIGELADHSYSYAVINAPTSDTTGSLSGTCENCLDTTIVPLPMLDTTDYSYSVIAEPSGIQTGIGRYTWKTADYGTIYFDVEIACTQLCGDFDQDDSVTDADALYLLRFTLFPDRYPISQNGDVDGDGRVTDADALYLLRYTLFPERYPLKT